MALSERLLACAEKVGGKKALAAAVGMSETTLYRYLNGETEMPAKVILRAARAAGVDAGWLLTGEEALPKGSRPPMRPALMTNLIEQFETLLLEYEKPFSPRQRALAVQYMYDALRHEEVVRGKEITVGRTEMVEYVSFLADMRNETLIRGLQRSLDSLEYGGEPLTAFEQNEWQMLVCRAWASLYNSAAGQAYFDRMTFAPNEFRIKRLDALIEEALRRGFLEAMHILDVGCGNGRELSYLWRQNTKRQVHGLELSERGVKLAQQLESMRKLPAGCVVHGNMLGLPYDDNSMDVVNFSASLDALPLLEDKSVGMRAALAEAWRVLKPGGVIGILTLDGKGRQYLPFRQILGEGDVCEILEQAGFVEVRVEMLGGHVLTPQQLVPSNVRDKLWLQGFAVKSLA